MRDYALIPFGGKAGGVGVVAALSSLRVEGSRGCSRASERGFFRSEVGQVVSVVCRLCFCAPIGYSIISNPSYSSQKGVIWQTKT